MVIIDVGVRGSRAGGPGDVDERDDV